MEQKNYSVVRRAVGYLRYDTPKTPYQRVRESKHIDSAIKRKLKRQYEKLNPAELKRNITKLQNKLMELATSKANTKKKGDFVYNFHKVTEKYFV